MPHELPKLRYDFSALEPHIDTRTMAIHHDKHHQAYLNNLNQALEGYEDLQGKSTIELLMELEA
jgi:Fe-Mn family superoxide dismutase